MAAAVAASAPDTHLNGDWVLDIAASDNFDARVGGYMAASEKREREHRRRRHDMDDVERIAGSPDDVPMEATERARERLNDSFRPAARLHVEVDGDTLTLGGDGLPARSYLLGQNATRMDSNGTATIGARWTGAALEIRSRYTNRALHVQQFTVDRSGTTLKVLLQVKDPMAVPLQVTSTYRRTP